MGIIIKSAVIVVWAFVLAATLIDAVISLWKHHRLSGEDKLRLVYCLIITLLLSGLVINDLVK